MQFKQWSIDSEKIEQIIKQSGLAMQILRTNIEDDIASLVSLEETHINQLIETFTETNQLSEPETLKRWLEDRDWSEQDLRLHVCKPEALKRFSEQKFGPGLEEYFLSQKHKLDVVLYSLLRVRDPGLALELWIQISEGEIRLEDAAAQHSDGPEANSRGLIGPMALGDLQPELAERLRHLQPGDLRPPEALGPWILLLRLEQLTPARLDDTMRQRLLREQMDAWLETRCKAVLNGEEPDELHYDLDP